MSEDAQSGMQLLTLATLESANNMKGLSDGMRTLSGLFAGFKALINTLEESVSIIIEQFGYLAVSITKNVDIFRGFQKNIIDFGNTMVPIRQEFFDLANSLTKTKTTVDNGEGGMVEAFKGIDFSQIIKGLMHPFRTIGKGLIGKGSGLGGLGKGLGKGLGALGPQMLAMTLIMKPISALLEGLLEPLEPLIDLFGMVGEILGLLLVPIVDALMKVLMPFMPLLMEIVMALMPLIEMAMIPLLTLAYLLTSIMPYITWLISTITWFTTKIKNIVMLFMNTITNAIDKLVFWRDVGTIERPEEEDVGGFF